MPEPDSLAPFAALLDPVDYEARAVVADLRDTPNDPGTLSDGTAARPRIR